MRVLLPICAIVVLLGIAGPASASSISPRIVGGAPAEAGAWPGMAYLVIDPSPAKPRSGDERACGGVVVGPRHVLTAAHCVLAGTRAERPSSVSIVIGRLDPGRAAEGGTVIGFGKVLRIAINPDYERGRGLDGGPFDSAVIEVPGTLPRPYARLATAADAPAYADGALAAIAGWGLTANDGQVSDVLMTARVPVIGDERCAQLAGIPLAEAILMICAGYEEGGVDSCRGDSGGPLVVPAADGRSLLAGIVSWGFECAAPGRPGIYTRVATIQPWIGRLLRGDAAEWRRSSDAVPPRAIVRRAVVRRGERARLAYRVTGGSGTTRERITIARTKTGQPLATLRSKPSAKAPGRDAHVAWRVPPGFPAGAHWWCVTSTDATGSASAPRCARLIVR